MYTCENSSSSPTAGNRLPPKTAGPTTLLLEEPGGASDHPSSSKAYYPEAPPSYDVATSSNVPQQVYNAQPQLAGSTIITTQPVFTAASVAVVGSSPVLTVCQACHCQVLTRVESEPSMATHLSAGILCLTG